MNIFALENLKKILSNPGDNPQHAVIIVVLAIAVIFMAVIVVAIISVKESQKKDPKEVLKRSAIWFGAWFFIFVVVLSLSFRYTSSDSYCGKCHYEKKFTETRDLSAHKKAGCLSCHQRPGVLGVFQEKVLLLNRILIKNKIIETKYRAKSGIFNESCLQCHEDLGRKVIVSRGTRVAHKHIIEKGYKCTDCHNQVGHGNIVQPEKVPIMEECMTCHDGKKVFNNCQGCHADRIPVRGKIEDYPKIGQKRFNDCTGCHSTQSCSGCHNMKIPHGPEYFNDIAGHAREASSIPRETCVRCHKDNSCSDCHQN